MIVQLVIIVAVGAALVWLQRSESATATDALPDDVWAAFYSATGGNPTPTTAQTLVTMPTGSRGWIDIAATAVDLGGTLWLFRHAIIHQDPGQERIEVRRDAEGYHLAHHDSPVALLDDRLGDDLARVRVTGRF